MYELDTKSSDSMAGSIILVIIFGIIASVLFVISQVENEILLFIPISCLSIVIFFSVANILHQIRKRMIIAHPRIALSTLQAKPGDTLTLAYAQRFKSRTNVKLMRVQFVLRESATYQQGTDTYTVTHDHTIQQIDLPPQTFRSGHQLERNWQLHLPPNAMHTFKGKNNKLLWMIVVNLEFNRNMKSNFESELTVLPEAPLNI